MKRYEDTYRHKGLRQQLVDTLKEKGITNETVLDAINNIPRHFFLTLLLIKLPMKTEHFQ